MSFIVGTVVQLLNVLSLVILASVIISWLRNFGTRVPRYHPVVRIIEDTAELLLRPIRRHLPVTGGGWDFSPIIAIVVIQIVQRLLARAPF